MKGKRERMGERKGESALERGREREKESKKEREGEREGSVIATTLLSHRVILCESFSPYVSN